jgi:hypothetical protein
MSSPTDIPSGTDWESCFDARTQRMLSRIGTVPRPRDYVASSSRPRVASNPTHARVAAAHRHPHRRPRGASSVPSISPGHAVAATLGVVTTTIGGHHHGGDLAATALSAATLVSEAASWMINRAELQICAGAVITVLFWEASSRASKRCHREGGVEAAAAGGYSKSKPASVTRLSY